jgi:Fe-S-cluster containining protein
MNDIQKWDIVSAPEGLSLTNTFCNVIIREIDLRGVDVSKTLCFCGSGKRHDKCHAEVTDNSAMAYLFETFKIIDDDIKRANVTPECQKGCSECCSSYFDVSPIEYFQIYKYIQTKYTGHQFHRLKRNARMLKPDFSPLLYGDKLDLRFTHPCVFVDNRSGKCRIYEVRPLTCRMYGYYQRFTDCLKAKDMLGFVLQPLEARLVRLLSDMPDRRLPAMPLIYWLGSPAFELNADFRELYAVSFNADKSVYFKMVFERNFGIDYVV